MAKNAKIEIPKTRWDKLSDDIWWKYNRARNKDEWRRIAVTERYCNSGRILEIGCGNGDLYTYLVSWGHEVYGVDISEIAIRRATARCLELGLKGFFAVDDGGAIPIQDSCFDTVILPEVVEHLEDPLPILLEAKRLCRNGGKIIITVPNGNMIPDEDHKIIFSHERLKEFSVSCFGKNISSLEGLPEQWIGIVATNDKTEVDIYNSQEAEKTLSVHFSKVSPEHLDSSKHRVSVIIPTYNRSIFLRESIESIINQSYKNIEIIVVNDGSNDNTADILSNYKNVIYIEQENKGKSAAINNAMRVATGDFIWVMDDDDIANPFKAEMQVRQFIKHPDIGIIGTDMCVINADNSSVVSMLQVPICSKNEVLLKMLESNIIYGSSAMIRRECFSKSGGFDENLRRSVDYDMYLRVVFDYPAKLLDFPTIMLRSHSGIRGSRENAFDASEIERMWKLSNETIFKKIYKEKKIQSYCKVACFKNDDKFKYISDLYTRVVGLLSNGCYDYAIIDYRLINYEIKKIRYEYYTLSDFDKYIEYILNIQNIINNKLTMYRKDIIEEDRKFISDIMMLYVNSIGRDYYCKLTNYKYYKNIIRNKLVIKYLLFMAIIKIRNILTKNYKTK